MAANIPLTFKIYKGDELEREETLTQDIIKINNQNIAAVDQLREGNLVNKYNDKTVRLIGEKLLAKLSSKEVEEAVLEGRDTVVQNVRAKQAIVRLLDASRIEMEVSVPESLISLAPAAYDIRVEFDAYPGRIVPASITEIGDEASAATRTYPVTVVMDPPADMEIKPGMAGTVTAKADLPEDAAEAGIEIPLSALFAPPDDPEKRSNVWIVDPDALQVSRREVSVQQLAPWGARVRGLEPGERVVTVGVHHLREGQRVSLLD